jgi:hypothetical protein
MKQGIFLYTLPPDIRTVMMGPRLSITFDEGVEIPTSYRDQIEVLRPKLELPEVVQHIIDVHCLLDSEEYFDGDVEGTPSFTHSFYRIIV